VLPAHEASQTGLAGGAQSATGSSESAKLPSTNRSECCCGSDCTSVNFRLHVFLLGVSGFGLWHSPFELQQLFFDGSPAKSCWHGRQPPIARTTAIIAGSTDLVARTNTVIYTLARASDDMVLVGSDGTTSNLIDDSDYGTLQVAGTGPDWAQFPVLPLAGFQPELVSSVRSGHRGPISP
jgi:hypothetical protein